MSAPAATVEVATIPVRRPADMPLGQHTFYDRKAVLAGFADGTGLPEVLYGPDREYAARELAAYLAGIRPTEGDRVVAAFTPGSREERRRLAFDAGVRFLHDAYYSYGLTNPEGTDLA